MQSLVLDIISAVIILFCAAICYYNGFANSVVRLAGWLAALVVSSVMSRPVAGWIYDSFLHGRILNSVEEQMRAFASPDELVANIGALLEGLPLGLSGILRIDGMAIADWVASLADRVAFTDLADAIVDAAITPVVTPILGILCFFVMFAVFSIAVRLLASAMKLINEIPIVGRVNAVLGAGVGALQGVVIVYLLALVLNLAVLLTGDGLSFIREQDAQNAYLFSYFYNATYNIEYPFQIN